MTTPIRLTLLLITATTLGFSQQSAPTAKATAEESELEFWDIPNLEPAFYDASPDVKKDGIPVGKLGADGGDKAMILQLAKKAAQAEYGKFDSFLIAYQGKLLFESYFIKGRSNLPHPQASATKAYTCLALGRAIQLGYLSMADLDKPLVHFLKDLDPSKFTPGAEKITLAKALTMRSGIRVSDEHQKMFEEKPELLQGQQEVQLMLEHSAPITEATQTFKYQSDPRLVMQVLEAVVPGSAMDFLKKELLDKLGISNYEWRISPSGIPEAGWRTGMTSRDMIKWGQLVRDKGQWKGEQLVPQAYLEKALSRIVLTGDDDIFGGGKDVSKQGYGYYWWSADLKVGNTSYFTRSAQGGGGQYIILIEELDLMVVVTGHDNENRTLQMVAEHIIPAFL